MGNTHIKVQHSLFISCEFNIPAVIAFYALLWQLKKSLSLDRSVSTNEPRGIILFLHIIFYIIRRMRIYFGRGKYGLVRLCSVFRLH